MLKMILNSNYFLFFSHRYLSVYTNGNNL